MTQRPISLERVLSAGGEAASGQRELFALVALGVLESLENGLWSPAESLHFFFTFENCEFVKNRLCSEHADAVMARGVQLADLREALAEPEATRELAGEISLIRQHCLRLLESERLVA